MPENNHNEISTAQRIHDFDVQILSEIRWINEKTNIHEFKDHFHIVVRDILMASDNSLADKFYHTAFRF